MEQRIERLEELAIALNAEIEKAIAAVPEVKAELQAFLAARMAELSADAKTESKRDLRAQCEAIRLEVAGAIESKMAVVLAKRQEVCQLAEIEPALKAFAERAAAGVLREFAAAHRGEMSEVARTEFAKAPKVKHDFAAGAAALADAMKGNWDKDATYRRGDIFTFRGSSYIVLRESRGVLPTQQEQKPPSPRYSVIAAAGSPGANGTNGLSAQSVGITSSSLTMNTGRVLARTTAGSGSIEEITAGSNLSLSAGTLNLASSISLPGQVSALGTGQNAFGAAFTPTAWGTASLDVNGASSSTGGLFAVYYNGTSTGYLNADTASSVLLQARTGCSMKLLAPNANGITISALGVANVASSVATPAGGSTSAVLLFGTSAGFGIYYGSGAPTVSAGQGSLYLRSDGSSSSTRVYVNSNGTTGWVNITTAS